MKRLIKKIFEPAGFVVRVIGKSTDDQVGAYAAQSAFFILMSLFPFLILLLQLMKYAPVSQEDLLFTVDSIFPDYLLPALHDILQELYSSSFGYIGISSVTTLWAAWTICCRPCMTSCRSCIPHLLDISESHLSRRCGLLRNPCTRCRPGLTGSRE